MRNLMITLSLLCAGTVANAQLSKPKTNNFTTGYGNTSGYYITSKVANRALTRTKQGTQIAQTQMAYSSEPDASADITFSYFGDLTNPDGFAPGTYTAYKIQWGNANTLNNLFWDIYGGYTNEGTALITWPCMNASNQVYIVQWTGDYDSAVYIRSLASGKYLQVVGPSPYNTESGATISLHRGNFDVNQKFYIRKRRLGTVSGLNQELNISNGVSVYPNPASTEIRLSGLPAEMQIYTASIIDMSGRIVSSQKMYEGTALNIANLPAGAYTIVASNPAVAKNISLPFIKK